MELSKYQKAICNHGREVVRQLSSGIVSPSRHLMAEALAGSAKSTTAKHLSAELPLQDDVTFVAFNKLIADDLNKDVVNHHPKATASTFHSLGFRILKSAFRGIELDKYKTDNILKSTEYDLNDRKQKSRFYVEKGAINRLVSLLKAEATLKTPTPDEVLEVADKYDVEIPGEETRIAKIAASTFEISAGIIESHRCIDFDDMVFGPVFYNLNPPQHKWMIVDEFQDWNKVQLDLLFKLGLNGTIWAFGDRHQAIYRFRGAMARIIDLFVEMTGATRLPLSICYRCPKAVIREAQKYVPEIEPAPNAKEGTVESINEDQFNAIVGDGDFILCRYTAPLVSRCLKMIEQGRKAFVKGRDIGANLLSLLDKINSQYPGSDLSYKVSAYRYDEEDRLGRLGQEDRLVELRDKADTLLALIGGCEVTCQSCGGHRSKHFIVEGATFGPKNCSQFEPKNATVYDVEQKIKAIFSDENQRGMMFTTIHRSKGLECPNIHILQVARKGTKKGKELSDEALEQEQNIDYVAVTRSNDKLYYVKCEE